MLNLPRGHAPALNAASLLLLLSIAPLSAAYLSPAEHDPVASHMPRTSAGRRAASLPAPPVEPLVLREMTPDRARQINAAIPFVTAPNPPARPFTFPGSSEEREKAAICLASAAWYEAGDDPVGQRAVVQVVLNRLRHPAYPKSVCGVVFQGSERKTGCQFTFTCDGALQRTPSPAAWQRAREVADRALSGRVEKAVGTATHYHTNWVVPYWSATLDKITEIHSHLFFRWRGWWGQVGAFRGRYTGPETLDPRIRYLAPPTATDAVGLPLPEGLVPEVAERPPLQIEGLSQQALGGNIPRLTSANGLEYGLQLDPAAYPGSYALVALAICQKKPACMVAGWLDARNIPPSLPVPLPMLRTVSFLYRKNEQTGRDQAYWNCRQFPAKQVARCLPGTEPETASPTPEPPGHAVEGRGTPAPPPGKISRPSPSTDRVPALAHIGT